MENNFKVIGHKDAWHDPSYMDFQVVQNIEVYKDNDQIAMFEVAMLDLNIQEACKKYISEVYFIECINIIWKFYLSPMDTGDLQKVSGNQNITHERAEEMAYGTPEEQKKLLEIFRSHISKYYLDYTFTKEAIDNGESNWGVTFVKS